MKSFELFKNVEQKYTEIDDKFFKSYESLIRKTAIHYQWEALNDEADTKERSGCLNNFKIAAGLKKGEFYGFVFQDSDAAKWLEGVSYSLISHPDKKLEALADETIELIGRAQQKDGYLDTYYIIKDIKKRWTNLHDCHELYCAGHMIEAGVAYYKATGKKSLLNIVSKMADHIDSVFGEEEGKLKGYPGHPEIELALVKLYKATENEKYLKLSRYFINERGKEPYYFDKEWELRGGKNENEKPSKSKVYNQSHLPVIKQEKAVGHAVRAVYLYSAMADIAALCGDEKLLSACRKLFMNIAKKQLYITGGIGATSIGEAFTFDYDLPNDTVYAETCASIGLIFFANRMLHIEAKSIYADVMERALYNTVMASMALDGKHFFYVNPLEVLPEACEKNPEKFHVKPVRQAWFGCACCPPNLIRLIESLGLYIYTQSRDSVYVNLYIGSKSNIKLNGSEIILTQKTDYPWNGKVDFNVKTESKAEFTVALRLPSWCEKAEISVNGAKTNIKENLADGYILIKREWQNGDNITANFDMPVELTEANPKVRADAGKAAITRGPLVYCLEEADNGKNLSAISFSPASRFTAHFEPELLGGVTVIEGEAKRTSEDGWNGELYKPYRENTENIKIKAVPYFSWGNRGVGEMQVFTRIK